MSAQHTPGPWSIFRSIPEDFPGVEACGSQTSIIIYGESRYDEACGVRGRTPEERLANAHLIAAAPDLLEALKMADAALSEIYMATADTKEQGREHVASDPTLLRVRAAIAKAEGRS